MSNICTAELKKVGSAAHLSVVAVIDDIGLAAEDNKGALEAA